MKTILAIETSCDETGIAVVRGSGKIEPVIIVLADIIASQIAIHKKYGGVVPHLAAREHEKNLPIALRKALKKSGIALADIDVVAVTKGPGLSPALWRGINFAKDLAKKLHKPLFGVDHMEGHLAANFISAQGGNEVSGISNFKFQISKPLTKFPILCLTVSGGHTQLMLMRNWARFELLGETLDDAAGEAFDKVARMLGLPYPGGLPIAHLAAQWKLQITNPPPSLKLRRTSKSQTNYTPPINLPRPMLHTKDYNFSFSGLKTAVLYDYQKRPRAIQKSKSYVRQMSYEFQQAVIDVLVKKTIRAANEYKIKTILMAGGVAANQDLRGQLEQAIKRNLPNTKYRIPNTSLCTDNGAMIGAAAYIRLAHGTKPSAKIQAEPTRLITDP